MKKTLLTIILIFSSFLSHSQQLLLLDRFNGNTIVNNSTITVFNSESTIPEITQYFTMKNNTDRPLALFLRKTVNIIADSTTDYYCFGIRCWPGDDSTNIADTIPAGGEDYSFASHVVHKRRFDIPQPSLPPGISSITYTVYDKTTFSSPVEATVTVIYDHSGLGVEEAWGHGGKEAGNEMRVFPNPALDWVTVEFEGEFPGNYKLMIFNCFGVVAKKFDYSFQNNQLVIPVSEFSPGLYFGKLVSEKGAITGFRFLVAR